MLVRFCAMVISILCWRKFSRFVVSRMRTRLLVRSGGHSPMCFCQVDLISARRRCQSCADFTSAPFSNLRREEYFPVLVDGGWKNFVSSGQKFVCALV